MKAPTCSLCSKEHWSWESHAGIGPVHNSAKSWRDVTIKPENVTIIPDVTLIPEDVTVNQRGRPKTGSALTAAQRKALSRQRRAKS